MLQRVLCSIIFLFLVLFTSACGKSIGLNGEYPYGHYEDDKMIGIVQEVDKNENSLVVDISEWEKRDRKSAILTDEGYSYTAKLSEETLVKYEDEAKAAIDDIKKGQKLLVNPPRGSNFEGYPDEVILLKMSFEEKYSQFLSHIDGFNIVVMYENSGKLPLEMQDSLYENVLNILEGTEREAVAAWIEYDKEYVVDYKDELGIEQFPAILVFDQKELLFKAYNTDEVYAYFEKVE